MSTDLDLVERAVILAAAVVCTVVDSATDVFVCKFSSHNNTSFRFVCRTQKRLYDYYEIFLRRYSMGEFSEIIANFNKNSTMVFSPPLRGGEKTK